MGMKKTYSCDICKDKIENIIELFGLKFSSNNKFTLGNYGCTEGTHICYECARQLAIYLSQPEIRKTLNIQQ